jgi:hypothetical protein
MKTAKNLEEAFKLFDHHSAFDGFIQWKGTDVCMDFHCPCGEANHYDGYFAYEIKCAGCGTVYAPSCNVEMVRVLEPNGDPLKSIFEEDGTE